MLTGSCRPLICPKEALTLYNSGRILHRLYKLYKHQSSKVSILSWQVKDYHSPTQ